MDHVYTVHVSHRTLIILCLLLCHLRVCLNRLWAPAPLCTSRVCHSVSICVYLCPSVFIYVICVTICVTTILISICSLLVELTCWSPLALSFSPSFITIMSTTSSITPLFTSIPKFSGTNWITFKKDVEVFFSLDGVWDVVSGAVPKPADLKDLGDWEAKDKHDYSLLYFLIGSDYCSI